MGASAPAADRQAARTGRHPAPSSRTAACMCGRRAAPPHGGGGRVQTSQKSHVWRRLRTGRPSTGGAGGGPEPAAGRYTRPDQAQSPPPSAPAPHLPYLSLTILRGDFEEIVAGSFHEMNSAGLVVSGHIFPFLVRKTATKYVRLVTAYACKNSICHLCVG